MRLLINAHVYGWRMTGLMGAGGHWFLGFSRSPDAPVPGLVRWLKNRGMYE